METKKTSFNYNEIPLGFYDDIAHKKKGMRSFWHNQKFKRVIDCFSNNGGSILDIGCFSGTFLSLLPENIFSEQFGVDILKEQVEYANKHYGSPYRKFKHIIEIKQYDFLPDNYFDCVSIIEVIEHLNEEEINNLLRITNKKLKKGGKLILTTPNYFSFWPILEFILNKISDVKYEDQHITKFNYLNFKKQLGKYIEGFDQQYSFEFVTTTHAFSPYVALFSYKLAEKLSSKVRHKDWKFPMGSLILTVITKK